MINQPATHPINDPIIPKNTKSRSFIIMLLRETPGFTSPNAVLVTTNNAAEYGAGSCVVSIETTKKVVPTAAANNNAASPSSIESFVPGLIKSNK